MRKRFFVVAGVLILVALWQYGQEDTDTGVEPVIDQDAAWTMAPAATAAAGLGGPQAADFPGMPAFPAMPSVVAMGPLGSMGSMAPPMDMSGLIANQANLQAMGDHMAHQAAMAYYEAIQAERRRTGDYTTPSAPAVSSESLRHSIAEANRAGERYRASGAASSAARAQASGDWSTRAMGGNEVWNPSTASRQRVDGSMSSYYLDQYGVVHGVAGEAVPNGTTRVTPRW